MTVVKHPTMIQKVPLSKQRFTPQVSFPKMPTLYLELVENKEKVKQHLVNKQYVPKASPTNIQPLTHHFEELTKNDLDAKERSSRLTSQQHPTAKPLEKPVLKLDDDEVEDSNEDDDVEDDYESEGDKDDDDSSNMKSPSVSDEDDESDISSSSTMNLPPRVEKYTPYRAEPPRVEKYPNQPEVPKVNPYQVEPPKSNMSDIQNMFREGSSNKHMFKERMPSLNDLNLHKKVIPNLENMEINTEKEDLKRELLFKFDLLKKSYKDVKIPDFSIHSDYNMMKRSYDNTVKRVSIDSSVDSYKTYLIGGFMLVEYVLGNWLKFDMQGFTQQQVTSMSSYDRLLIELGEKSYVDEESQWPVEVRLLGLIIMNAGFFLVSKLIMKKTGSNIMNMINSMNMKNQQEAPATAPKRKMRAPNIDINNLPDFTSFASD